MSRATAARRAMRQHVAVEFMHPIVEKRRALPAIALSADIALLTAVGNDGRLRARVRGVSSTCSPRDRRGARHLDVRHVGERTACDASGPRARRCARSAFTGRDGGPLADLMRARVRRAELVDPPHPGGPHCPPAPALGSACTSRLARGVSELRRCRCGSSGSRPARARQRRQAHRRADREVFLPALSNPALDRARRSGAARRRRRGARLAFTTDSYVVTPIFFPGGDIGELAVNGTINDLAMRRCAAARAVAAFILEEGLPIADLQRVLESVRRAARARGVPVVTGDTRWSSAARPTRSSSPRRASASSRRA